MENPPNSLTGIPGDQLRIRAKCVHPSGGFIEFRKEDIEQSIPERFEQQVAKNPQRLAVKTKTHRLTYEELNQFSNCIAGLVLSECGEGEETIGLLLDQGAPSIAAIIGVLKAGKIYVPMDPSHPKTRIEYVMEDAQIRLVITDKRNLSLANELAWNQHRVIDIDQIEYDSSHENHDLSLSSNMLAYIFYTSGSTGQPKGVVDNHRNVLHNIMRYTNSLRVCLHDRVTLLQSCSFSGAVSSLFCAVLNGAAVFPYDIPQEGMGINLANWLIRERITIYHSVPMIFRSFLNGDLRFPAIRIIRLEGDAASKVDINLFRKHFGPDCILVNGLGATETGLTRQYFIDKNSDVVNGLVPIGYTVEDMEVLLVDDDQKEVGVNCIGEIAIRSSYLSPGYWRKPDLTQKVFLSDTSKGEKKIYKTGDMGCMHADGCLEYLGRKDFQLKIRGFRIDPTEVEIALLNIDGIKEAVVSTFKDAHDEAKLAAYFVPSGKPAPTPVSLRQALAQSLPDYSIPMSFVILERLPLNTNGKVNRRALPEPEQIQLKPSTSFMAPRNNLEQQLANIWEELLKIKPVGVKDNFFELGGNSLLAAQMSDRIQSRLGKNLALASIYQAPTIEKLANVFREDGSFGSESVVIAMRPSGCKPPFFCVHGHKGTIFHFADLVRHLDRDQPFYGLQSFGISGKERPITKIEAMASKYISAMCAIQPEGPYFLGGHCFGAVVAFEMAQQLWTEGQEVAFLALIDISPSDFPKLILKAGPKYLNYHNSLTKRLKRKYIKLLDLGTRERLLELKEIVAFRINKIRKFSEEAAWKVAFRFCEIAGLPLPRILWSIEQANKHAIKLYVPKKYPGRVNVFVSSRTMKTYSQNSLVDWQKLAAGGAVIHEVPGDKWPKVMLREPYVQVLAEKLYVSVSESGKNKSENLNKQE